MAEFKTSIKASGIELGLEENPIPCFNCDYDTTNKSMFFVGVIHDKLIYQYEKCKRIEIRELKSKRR